MPKTGNTLYLPRLVISWPVPIEVSSRPAISGSSRSPEMVGLLP